MDNAGQRIRNNLGMNKNEVGQRIRQNLGLNFAEENNIQNDTENDGGALKNIFKTPKNFEDGYQFGDVTKTALSSGANILASGIKGIAKFGEGIGDLGQYGVAQVADWLGNDDLANKIRKNAQEEAVEDLYNMIGLNKLSENSIFGKTSDDVVETIGNVVGQASTGGLLKGASSLKLGKYALPTTSIVSGMSSGITEAYNNGATNGEAALYGLGSGLVEGFSESLFGGLGKKYEKVFGKGALDDTVINKITSKITNQTLKTITQSGLKATGEGVEELVSGIGSIGLKKLTYLSDEDFKKIVTNENLLDQFLMGTITSAIMQTPSTFSAIKNKTDYISLEDNQNLNNKSTVINDLRVNDTNIPLEQNTFENGLKGDKILYNQNINKNTLYQAEQTDNQKVNKFRESAIQYNFNNTTETHNLFDTIEKIIQDKDYNIVFDDTIKNKLGNSVNAQIKSENNGIEIRINPNSNRTGEFLLTHEITHAIETEKMKNLIIDYASKHADFNESLEVLKQTYGTNDVSSEVMADISGQLFGNQEFINNLSLKQPNIFKQIYNKIIELANKITGNSKEGLFLKDLRNKWETAYRNTNIEQSISNLNNNSNFSIQMDINGNKYVNVDTNQDIFEGKNLTEQTKIAKQYILDNFRQNGIDVNNENINVTSKTANEYTHPKNQLPVATKTSKMKASTELNNLLSTSEYKYSKSDDGRHPFAKDGWDYYETTFKVGDNLFTGLVNIGKNGNKKTLYDITNIKRIDQNRGTSANAFSTSLVNSSIDNISQSNDKVNSNTSSTKYSMQNNENNTQRTENSSFSFADAKQYDDLIKTNYIEYFRKDNGDVNVYLMDSNNNLLNEFSLWSNTNASKELGENLGNKIYETATNTRQRINIGNDINEFGYFPNDVSNYIVSNNNDLNKYIFDDEFYNQFQYEDKSKITKTINELKQELTTIDENTDSGWEKGYHIRQQIRALENGYSSEYDYVVGKEKERLTKDYKFGILDKKIDEKKKLETKKNQLEQDIKESTPFKNAQYKIIQETNPAPDGNYVWIRSPKDIKTFEEVINDKDSFTWGDYSKDDALRDLKRGKVKVYSSYAIKNGVFVSTSYQQALDYAGSDPSKVHSREVALNSVAWINGDEGQYAKVYDTKYSQQNDKWQDFLEKNFKATGTRTNMNNIRKGDMILLNNDVKSNTLKAPLAPRAIPKDPTKESSYDFEKTKTRKQIQEELLGDMGIDLEDISIGNDINSIDMSRTDPIRLNEKVFGYKVGQKINDATINKTKHNEAEKVRWLNKERKEIESLGIKPRSKESEAVQKYGEKQYVTKNNEVVRYGDYELAKDFPDVKVQEKIKNAAKVIRNKYDTYIDDINRVITEMGYKPISKRKDYMKHFEALSDLFSKYGLPLNRQSMMNDSLPTDINGLTDQFKPGKNFFTSAMERIGMKTSYDAITGIDSYLEGAGNLIYHTEDIQRYRTLSKFIRDTYGSQHGFDDYSSMTSEEQIQRYKDIRINKLSKYAAWLDEQANSLAGKKGKIDRGIEETFGRKMYTICETAKKQVGSNMTGFNVRSALTNFASAVQGASKTNKLAFIKGTISSVNNLIHNDNLANKSDFLTSRFGSKNLSQKLWQKSSNVGQIFMEGTDYFTANQIWRSKYFENLSKGMKEKQAIKNADDFSARIMGDRSKGATATLFNSKAFGFLTQFQLEVNNQWSSLIHDNKIDIQSGNKTGATVVFQLGQLAAMSYLFNNFMKSVTGSAVMIDPIDLLKKIFNPDDEDKSIEERATEVLGDVLDDMPFASIFNGGRIPVGEAFKGGTTLFKAVTNQTDSYGNKYKLSDAKDDIIESSFYWLLPTGYGQIRKSIKGIQMYSGKLPTAGSYTKSGNLRFSADESTKGKIKAVLFGQYSNEEAQKYIDSGYKTINKNKIQEMKELNMTSSEYRNYKKELSSVGEDINSKLNYINKQNYSIKQKNIMANNMVNSNIKIDMEDYKNYSSYDEYKYAVTNKNKYKVLKNSKLDYSKYQKIKQEINDIKKNSSTKKNDVFKYINKLPYSKGQKIVLFKMAGGYDVKSYKNELYNYINSLKLSKSEKEEMWKEIYGG